MLALLSGLPMQAAGAWQYDHIDRIESFNGKFRRECLNEALVREPEARTSRDCALPDRHNQVRPHNSCGWMPPAKCAAQHRQTTDGALPAPLQTGE